MRRPGIVRSGIVYGIVALTALYLAAFALNVTPYLRGPDAWRWAYAIPGAPWRHAMPLVIVGGYAVFVVTWPRRRVGAFLALAALAVPLIQAALLFPESPDVLRPLVYRTVSPGASGVFTVGSTIEAPLAFLRRYPELMPSFPVHPQRYPPGLPLLFYLARRALAALPALSDALGFALRRYQCHDLALMRLSNATLATAVVQMALPVVGGLIVFPLYGLARRTVGERAALWAAALYPLVPSFALWSARWDQAYPLLTCLAWYLFHRGLTEGRRWYLLGAGLTLGGASFLSLGPLAVLMPMGLAALLWALPHRQRRRWGRLALDAAIFFAGLAAPWLAYRLTLGVGLRDIARVAMGYHLGLARDDWLWLGYHLYDFLAFLGVPLALLLGVAEARALRRARADAARRDAAVLPLAFGLGLLLLDLSGTARGEVARVWLFLTPFAVIAAAWALVHLTQEDGGRRAALLVGALAAQLLVFNAVLRVVTTGVTDPPARDRTFTAPAMAHPEDARLGEAVALMGYDLLSGDGPAKEVAPGACLRLTLVWRARAPMRHPYTVFVHLLDPEGALAAQHDAMPMAGRAPTTCWAPGEVVTDVHEITVPDDAAPGVYTLTAGMYRLETGARLPTQGASALPEGRVLLTTVTVVGDAR
jgi:hypothetical protein